MFELLITLVISGSWGNGNCLPLVNGNHFLPPATRIAKNCPCSPLCVCGCNQGLPCRCNEPATPPEPEEAKGDGILFGVKDEMRGKAKERYLLNGREVPRYEAFAAVEKKSLIDDSKKYRITLIGSPESCKRIRDQIKGSDLEKDCLTQSYTPDHWAIKGAGFHTLGEPVVYLQTPDGKVLHRQDDGEGVIEALRKARPDYQPSKDPNGKANPLSLPDVSKLPWYVWAIGLGALWLLFKKDDTYSNKK